MPGALFLEGDSINLRTVEEEDLDFLQVGYNHPEIRDNFNYRNPANMEQQKDFFHEEISDDNSTQLLICRNNEPLGLLSLYAWQGDPGVKKIGIWIHPEEHGNGYGTEATELLLDHVFSGPDIHKVMARFKEDNQKSQGLWEKLGFTHEGTLRENSYRDGERLDVEIYGILREEWCD